MSEANRTLAQRLRRQREAVEGRLTQPQVARALGVSVATVSSDENIARGIPLTRLGKYATFYAAPRADEDARARLAAEDELTDEERAARDDLLDELKALRGAAAPVPDPPASMLPNAAPRRTWRFDDEAPVRVVCGQIPVEARSPLASPDNLNHTEMFSFADADALVELFGHIRAENPALDVRFRTSAGMGSDDVSGHLVLLGGLGWNQATVWYTRQADVPVTQISDPDFPDGEIFEVTRDGGRRKYVPRMADNPDLGLVEDLGLLVRIANPFNRSRTLTICNGVYSRGVLGAVRCLTDANLRERNEQYIFDRFGEAGEFGILMRVRVLRGKTITPDLHDPDIRLFEWP
ncbi:helix-turn-helix domain-containing protein [Frankia sp. CNm7]|uniref:Helix-turn-helix domain-containing protein n=2 Tax=Frankia nepalensis TaxID=1836974 RepID=A0A937UQU9_9ACTN|nr:helix-turn-helix transcriptional regulator [Frankia nepalensis]MBL7495513.1 helix-turn-helix domain-containing protein [Frankia nepalensis]MBL7510882.1 helix-turn-helix domain-containing protein [Frankia nepalensis]MBL7520415.1 helix-turn-helix domain-containing protein [Frankia nepalensis]MBL7630617.1 helix-turn-helix domain-containing protein [Frankia nepalensis]